MRLPALIISASILFLLVIGGVYYYITQTNNVGASVFQVYQGGTGAQTFTAGECLVGAGTGAITTAACGGGGSTDQLGQIGDVSTSSPMTYGEILIYNTATAEWESVATSTIGLGGSSGTVSNIATTYPLSGGPITTTGTLSLAFGTTTSNTWAGTQTIGTLTVTGVTTLATSLSGLLGLNAGVTYAVSTSTLNIGGLAGTATALAANGANCNAGNAPLGVDASGAVETCFDVWTEAENTSAAYVNAAGVMTGTFDGVDFGNGTLAQNAIWVGGAAAIPSELALGTAGTILGVSGGTLAYIATTTIPLAGDVTGTLSATVVGNDSHTHDSTTISGLDVSADLNLTAGDALTLTDDDIDFDGGATPAGALGGTWASPTVDSDGTWTGHNDYPAACSAGNVVQAIGDTLTCVADATGTGGAGTVSTSTSPTIGNLAYWTSKDAWPEKLGTVATTSASCTGMASCALHTVIGASPIVISGSQGPATTTVSCTGMSSCTQFNAFGASPISISGSQGSATSTLTATYPIAVTNTPYIIGASGAVMSVATGFTIPPTATVNLLTFAPFSAGSFVGTSTATSTLSGGFYALRNEGGYFYSTSTTATSSFTLLKANTLFAFGSSYWSDTATSTITKGINITSGCFAINNVCVGAVSGGSGTVTSVGIIPPVGMSVSGSPITTAGSITLAYNIAQTYVPFGGAAGVIATSSTFYFTTARNELTVTNASTTAITVSGLSTLATLAGTINASGAASFAIPTSATQTPAAAGQIAIDTTSDQLKYYGTAARTLVPYYTMSFNVSSSTWGTGTTTVYMAPAVAALTMVSAQCQTSAGTLNISLWDGTNRANMMQASTTVGTFTFNANNTFTAAEGIKVDVGTAATSPTAIGCRFKYTITAD